MLIYALKKNSSVLFSFRLCVAKIPHKFSLNKQSNKKTRKLETQQIRKEKNNGIDLYTKFDKIRRKKWSNGLN